MLIHNLEKGVRLIIKRDGPMKKFVVAKSNPPSLQLLVTAVHKTTDKKSSTLKLFITLQVCLLILLRRIHNHILELGLNLNSSQFRSAISVAKVLSIRSLMTSKQ